MTDRQLVALCLANTADAWDKLIERYSRLIYGVAYRVGLHGSDAEDVFQEVVIALYEHLDSLRDVERIAGWIATTTRRAAIHAQKKRGSPTFSEMGWESYQVEAAVPVGVEAGPTAEEWLLEVERQWRIHRATGELAAQCRQLLTLLYGREEPTPYAEVARVLRMPANSVGPNRARCLEKLRAVLEKNKDEDMR